MKNAEQVVVIDVVGLAPRHVGDRALTPTLTALAERGRMMPMNPTFPAVTCSVQATLLSGKPPSEHGIVANGYFDRATHEVKFWEQPAALVQAPRLWDLLKARRPELKTAVLFWQNSMFVDSDIVVTCATDGSSAIASSAAQVIAAIEASAAASALVTVADTCTIKVAGNSIQ